MFCSQLGGPIDPARYAATLRLALAKAKMARAGHSDFKTTQGYIDLAGETFREEAELADDRPFGQKSGQK